jgi:hypothetical protein
VSEEALWTYSNSARRYSHVIPMTCSGGRLRTQHTDVIGVRKGIRTPVTAVKGRVTSPPPSTAEDNKVAQI